MRPSRFYFSPRGQKLGCRSSDHLTGATMWNVRYKYQGKSRLYLTFPVPRRHTAEKAAEIFARKYVGKPYPNGKGFYPITDVEVVSV